MNDYLTDILIMAAQCMDRGGTLQDLHALYITYAQERMLDDPDDHLGAAMLACTMSRAVWRAMPNPSRQFRVEKLPDLGRNDACAIGLDCKHKQCCGGVPSFPPIMPEQCWQILIEGLPPARIPEMMGSGQFPKSMLAVAAHRFIKVDPGMVCDLLEPYFAKKLDHKNPHLGDLMLVLCDAYDVLGVQDMKIELLEQVALDGRGQACSDAWQRLATIYSDGGNFDLAWEAFGNAQRAAPDDPSLSHLEIVLLISQRRHAEAQSRAQFWVAKLQRLGYADDLPFLNWLRDIAAGQDPDQATARLTSDWLDEWARRMMAAVEIGLALPVPASALQAISAGGQAGDALETPAYRKARYIKHFISAGMSRSEAAAQAEQLEAQFSALEAEHHDATDDAPDEEGPLTNQPEYMLMPSAAMQQLEADWHRAWPIGKPFSTQPLPYDNGQDPWEDNCASFWVAFLEQHPEAMNSLDILDDLLIALALLDDPRAGMTCAALRKKVYVRARALLATVRKDEMVLPWAMQENRPALRLLVSQAYEALDCNDPDGWAQLREMLKLNPQDNHGLRGVIVNRLLAVGENQLILDIAAPYPNDILPALLFGKVLALYRLGEMAQALATLKIAHERSPKIVKFLLPKRMTMPALAEERVQIGGDDEAWLYRDEMRRVWENAPGALDWLKQSVKSWK